MIVFGSAFVRVESRIPVLAVMAMLGAFGCSSESTAPTDEFLDLDAPALAADLAAGRLGAEQVTRASLGRIARLDDSGPMLNAIIEVNPDAVEIARELDRRFAVDGPVGPLHGMPVVIKANIDTGDRMATSAGSLALAEHHAADDADLVARLRAAGAVIVAKANLSEWANFRGLRSTSGWSSLGGQTRNPYVLDRNPCGSSSGSAVAVAARLVPLAVGTETDGSIVCPASLNGVVGIKPTHGTVSQDGIIPIAASQDVAGPLARTVRGAALLLDAMRLPPEPASPAAPGAASTGARDGLDGIRLGIVRQYGGAGQLDALEAAFTEWLAILENLGAGLVDPVGLNLPPDVRDAELEVLLYEFRDGIEAYLGNVSAGPGSLASLIAFNTEQADEVMPHFGQELFEMAAERTGLDDPVYLSAVEASSGVVRARLAELMASAEIDALVVPVAGPAGPIDWANGDSREISSNYIAAISGYPSVAVPGGLIGGLPAAIAFIGAPGAEPALVEIAAAFEHARGPLPPPRFVASLESAGGGSDGR